MSAGDLVPPTSPQWSRDGLTSVPAGWRCHLLGSLIRSQSEKCLQRSRPRCGSLQHEFPNCRHTAPEFGEAISEESGLCRCLARMVLMASRGGYSIYAPATRCAPGRASSPGGLNFLLAREPQEATVPNNPSGVEAVRVMITAMPLTCVVFHLLTLLCPHGRLRNQSRNRRYCSCTALMRAAMFCAGTSFGIECAGAMM